MVKLGLAWCQYHHHHNQRSLLNAGKSPLGKQRGQMRPVEGKKSSVPDYAVMMVAGLPVIVPIPLEAPLWIVAGIVVVAGQMGVDW